MNIDGSSTPPSISHATLNVAANDAMEHGFQPAADEFLIDDVYIVSYFEPNELPKLLPKDS